MGNFQTIKGEVTSYIRSRVPLIIIETSERERAERMLSSIASELSTEITYYTETTQVIHLGGSGSRLDVSSDPLGYIADLFLKKRKVIFCYGDAYKISEDTIYSREIINILYSAVNSDSTFILITKDPVYSRIAQFGMIARLDYPDMNERISQIKDFIIATDVHMIVIEHILDEIIKHFLILRL